MALYIEENTPLDQYTTLQVGGPAEYFTEVKTEQELQEAVQFSKEKNIPITIIGGGSNVLISDTGVRGLVIHMSISGIEVYTEGDSLFVTAAAGEVFDDLIQFCVAKGYWGLENLSHIPGTVGAAPVQNVGAYGVEVKDSIDHVRVYDTQHHIFTTLSAEECMFSYRDSFFKTEEGRRYIITEVTFLVTQTPTPILTYRDLEKAFAGVTPSQTEIREVIIGIRSNKFPDWHTVGTAGSFFKNPIITKQQYASLAQLYPDMPSYALDGEMVKVPLGWILDKLLHLKGVSSGTVGVYKNQALVIVNTGDAMAADIQTFADNILSQVKEITGITIQWEVTKVGF